MKLISTLIICLISFCSYSQKLKGNYYGNFKKSFFRVGGANYEQAKLTLNMNNTFKFSYYKYHPCAAVTNFNRSCTGTFEINNDTLTLTSKYSANKFCEIKKYRKEKAPLDSVTIFLKPTKQIHLTGPTVSITTDSTFIGSYRIGDSIKLKTNFSSLSLSYQCLYNMDWKVQFNKEDLFSIYIFKLKTNINNENIFFNKIKFRIEKNKLIMVDDFYFLDIVDNEFTK